MHYSELQKANEVAKELKEKYGVKEVNLFTKDWFLYKSCFDDYHIFDLLDSWHLQNIFNKIITTNSTGVLEPQNTERLQVIDCKEIFEEWYVNNTYEKKSLDFYKKIF